MDCGQWQQTGVWRIRRRIDGQIADTVLARGGDVTGIEAQMFVDKGVAHHNLTQLVVVPNIVERRTRMIELGDVFIAFPAARERWRKSARWCRKSVLISWTNLASSIISTDSMMI